MGQKPDEKRYGSKGMTIGAALGLVFGLLLFDNLAAGLVLGVAIGLGIGSVVDIRANKDTSKQWHSNPLKKENNMNNKQTGALLLGTAGLVAAISVATTQIAYAIVLAGFYAGNMGGEVPASPQNVNLHWLVMTAVIVQAAIGLFYVLRPADKTL